MAVGSLKQQFFLAVLRLPVKDSLGYSKEIKCCFWIIKRYLEEKQIIKRYMHIC